MSEKVYTGIVVGTNGSAGSATAVEFAAREAERLGVGLAIVHVLPDFASIDLPTYVIPTDLDEDLQAHAHALLRDAAAAAARHAPGVACDQVLLVGRAVAALTSVAEHARLIVLGHETVAPWRRIYTGAVTMGVSARAAQPVISVPADWAPSTGPRRVVAGFKSLRHSAELLAAGFREASARGAGLVVVHAWSLPSMYDDRIVTRTHGEAWAVAARADIEDLLPPYRAEYPQVPVEINAVHDQGAHALLDASERADLVVLVRRGHGFPPATHLGGTARALLHRASCPVMVLPPQDTIADVPGLELESAGIGRLHDPASKE